MVFFFFIVTGFYVFLIGAFCYGFDKIKEFKTIKAPCKTRFSIIIAFRNEADNLSDLLHSLSLLNYQKNLFEIIFVDDASEDNSAQFILNYLEQYPAMQYSILNNKRISNSPKKDAITTAISKAKNEWIITTDADCKLQHDWLKTIDNYIQHNICSVIAAPVAYHETHTFLMRFQALDVISLMGATIGGFGINQPFMCNGANFIYKKETFLRLQGFTGNNTIASGDDIFLLEKAVQHARDQVHYLKNKDAIVVTKPQSSFKQLVQQRKRWAAKTSNYSSVFGKSVGALVLAMNLVLILAVLFTISSFISFRPLVIISVIKITIDGLLLFKTSRFFNTSFSIPFYILSSILYPFFTVFIAFSSLFSSYNWKGRHFKK